ncbi:MAG: DNA replication and repair protein RecF [Gammaproteobacteria bacterium]|nr:MAG: DNA replication and repair protein RecF [Gammaproteobacteria bacterium]TND03938.1 MAG: DNA replication and repair protein RecF [Gammaproteobacteria bacterium]
MSLTHLALRGVRNLADTEISPGCSVNLIWGENGSGKTSLLEAIHVLGRAKSFRSSRLSPVIQNGSDSLVVVGRVLSSSHGTETTVRVNFGASGVELFADRVPLNRVSDLVLRLPLILINTDSHRLLEDGPRLRRRFLDWGVFHVEHGFFGMWKRYYRALRQRNSAIRRQMAPSQLAAWEAELSQAADHIDEFRRQYLALMAPWFARYVSKLLDINAAEIDYRRGWPGGRPLMAILAEEAHLDRQIGYTRQGPHRADLVIKIANVPAQQVVSRGQQKLLICALHLAQAALMGEATRTRCVLLIDDLAAELDHEHRNRLLSLLVSLGQQVFVTATEHNLFDQALLVGQKLFHVERGKIADVTT